LAFHTEHFDNVSRLMNLRQLNLRHLAFASVRPFAGQAFAPNRLLEVTPDWLDEALTLIRAEGHDIVDMDEMAARITGPRRDRFAVALTFDDGYRDNHDHALPVLKRHDAPWMLYVTTGYADAAASLWWIAFEETIRVLPKVTLVIDGRIHDFDTRDAAGKQAAFHEIYWALRSRPEAELRAGVDRLCAEAGIDQLALTRSLCLDWDELRDLGRDPALTIGAHTLTHPMLAKHPLHVAQPEIVEAKYRIEFELGRPVHHLAYPVGDPLSAGAREFELAKQSGFRTAVTTRPGHVFSEHAGHLHALPRVSLNGFHQNKTALKAMLSGLPFYALNRGRKLSLA
jgi:peptidoglycan/xylan/chitin deacetylase (PgdA/CDA1 family)